MEKNCRLLENEDRLAKAGERAAVVTHLMTIFAQNINKEVFVFLRHWGHLNLIVEIVPQLFHVQHRCLTRRTSVMARNKELLEAGSMKQVTARWDMAWDARMVDVLQANSTI